MLAGTGSFTTMKRRRSSRSELNGSSCSREVAFGLIASLHFVAEPPVCRNAPTFEDGSVGASGAARVAWLADPTSHPRGPGRRSPCRGNAMGAEEKRAWRSSIGWRAPRQSPKRDSGIGGRPVTLGGCDSRPPPPWRIANDVVAAPEAGPHARRAGAPTPPRGESLGGAARRSGAGPLRIHRRSDHRGAPAAAARAHGHLSEDDVLPAPQPQRPDRLRERRARRHGLHGRPRPRGGRAASGAGPV